MDCYFDLDINKIQKFHRILLLYFNEFSYYYIVLSDFCCRYYFRTNFFYFRLLPSWMFFRLHENNIDWWQCFLFFPISIIPICWLLYLFVLFWLFQEVLIYNMVVLHQVESFLILHKLMLLIFSTYGIISGFKIFFFVLFFFIFVYYTNYCFLYLSISNFAIVVAICL